MAASEHAAMRFEPGAEFGLGFGRFTPYGINQGRVRKNAYDDALRAPTPPNARM